MRQPASHPPPGLGDVAAMHSTATKDLRAAFGFDDDDASNHSQEQQQHSDASPAAPPKSAAVGPSGAAPLPEGVDGMDEGMQRRFHWLQLEASPTRQGEPSLIFRIAFACPFVQMCSIVINADALLSAHRSIFSASHYHDGKP